jgi:Putative  PD-(D/E)XK family member, (DUF4420)
VREGFDGLLERAWSVLDAPSSEELATFPLNLAFSGIRCRVGKDRNKIRHLLVPSIDEMPAIDNRASVLSLGVRPLVFSGQTSTYLDVFCTDGSLHREFDEVIYDILEGIKSSVEPATDAAKAVARWRRLFRSQLIRGLSAEAKLGMFAELSVLTALLDVHAGFPIENWRGPLREPHDFETPTRCIEVKALGEGSDTFVVHGLEQLSEHGGKTLDLALVTVIQDADGTSLTDLVAAVEARIRSKTTFISRLLAVGWDHQSSSNDEDRYSLGPVFGVHVDHSVPRLIATSLVAGGPPVGLSNLRYEINVSSVIPLAFASSLATIARDSDDCD